MGTELVDPVVDVARVLAPDGRTGSSATIDQWSASGAAVEVRLLEGFRLLHGPLDVSLPLGAQRLIAFLALHPTTLTRRYVAGSLWLDVNDERAGANLRSALWRLRPLPFPVVRASRTHLRLDPDVQVDYHTALSVALDLVATGGDLGEIDHGVSAGELLPDWYEDWVAIERERFKFLRVHALERLCLRLSSLGRMGEAVDAGMSAVAAEPLRESAHRVLVSAHLAAGNWWDALRQYESYRTLMSQQLDLPPSEAMEALVQPLLRATPTAVRRRALAVGRSG